MIRNEIKATPIFSDHMPIRVLEKKAGRYVLETEFTDYHLNAAGSVHGGMLAAFLDCGLAGGGASSVNDGEGRYGITVTMTVNFIRGAGPGLMRCEAGVTGGGRATKFVEAKLFDGGVGPVASATGTVRVIELG
ncbi:MAG: PaaI family thioesterase [Minwuia sp.]|uniref:PaaI family thioesterase n=1 Tax=Minwuia sp. TaxID=2493630 RepID=UPI003A85A4F3